MAKLHTGTVGL